MNENLRDAYAAVRRHRRALALVILGLAAWLGCRGNPAETLLGPTGRPPVIIIDSTCVSQYDAILVVGDFTDPAWNIPVSPAMVEGAGCVWSALVRFSAGAHVFKLVTNGVFDNPPDFGWDENEVLQVGVENSVKRVTGQGTGIKLQIPVAGCYRVKLYEKALLFRADLVPCSEGGIRGTAGFENVSQPPYPRVRAQALQQGVPAVSDSSAAADGAFLLSGLAAGTYDVALRGFGYLDTTVAGVQVGQSVVDIGRVVLRAGCVSAHDTIQVAGDMTTPNFDLTVSPYMQQVEGCRWEATVPITAGTHLFKFVTDRAFDNPNDYGGDETQLLEIDTSYPAREVSGTGTAIKMSFPFGGDFRFILDEGNQTFRVEPGDISGDLTGILVFEGAARQPLPVADVQLVKPDAVAASTRSSSEDGSFRFTGADAGVYDVRVVPPLRAPTHFDSLVAGVVVSGGVKNLGQIRLPRATGGLRGGVGFSDVPAAPYPPASVVLHRGSALAESLVTGSSAPSYAISGLKPGDYAVRIAAVGYIDTTFSVTIARGTTSAGPVLLQRLVCARYATIQQIQLAGREISNNPNDSTFTWNLGRAPVMDHVDRCRWQASITAPQAADYRIKFITNQDFGGDPPDFGGDDTGLIAADSTAAVQPVNVVSTGLALRIRIAAPGVYRFQLDLASLTFSFTKIGDLPPLRRAAAKRSAGRPAAFSAHHAP